MSQRSCTAWLEPTAGDESAAQRTREVLARYFDLAQAQASGAQMAALFTEDLVFDIPRPSHAIPWSGSLRTRPDLAEFIDRYRAGTQLQRFNLQQCVVEGNHAIAMGELVLCLKACGTCLFIEFASHYTLLNGLISQLKIYERTRELDEQERQTLGLPVRHLSGPSAGDELP